eukprot:s2265_g4.t1
MPGKWVGGKGSLAAPTKGQFIEAQVYDRESRGQGTIFLLVKRLFGTGATGRTILADLISATDEYNRHWITTEEGAPTTVDGSYHLCKGDPTICTGGGGEHVVHVGKWRTWKEAELVAGEAITGNRGAEEMMLRYFKEGPRGKEQEKQKKKERLTRLQLERKALQEEIGSESEEKEKEKKVEKKKKKEKGRRGRSPTPKVPRRLFSEGGRIRKEESDSSESSSGASTNEEDEKKKERKKAIERKAARADEEKRKKRSPKKRERSKEKKKDKKEKRRAKAKGRDHGPFGVAPSETWEEKESAKGSTSSSSASSDQSFQKAPSSTAHHMKLVRYAKRHPGRLVARLLRKMQSATGFGGGAETKPKEKEAELRAVAHMYFLAVMTPALRDKWSPRTQRELKICTSLLDLMVLGKGPEVADILTQRIKALEKSAQDNNQWRKAKHLELIEGEDIALADQGEENTMAREAEREERLRRGSTWQRQEGDTRREGGDEERRDRDRLKVKPAEPEGSPGHLRAVGPRNEADDDWGPAEEVAGESRGEASATEGKTERNQSRRDFEKAMKGLLGSDGFPLAEIGYELMQNLGLLKTKFGRFKASLDEAAEGAAEKVKASGPGASDLLPFSVEGVLEAAFLPDRYRRNWIAFSVLSLNFWYCTGWERPAHLEHPRELTGSQKDFILYHLGPALDRMLEGNPTVPPAEELDKILSAKGQDYDGHTWVVMEELDAAKILPCWPDKGKAAVQPIIRFLSGETLAQVEKPRNSILPWDEWPEKLPKSYVRASDSEWEKIVSEGYKRSLFHHCPDNEVLTGPDGAKVVNGAGAVPKEKDGVMQQRFISIFCPLNSVSRKVEGEEASLPYVGQICLINVPDEQDVLLDSEDLQSAFNLFTMPLGWRGLFCYEKKVRGDLLGLPSPDPVFVALRTIPMGWLSAVGIVQAGIGHLAFVEAGLPLEGEIQKGKQIPQGDKYLLYLDSVDQLRPVSKAMTKILEGQGTAEHDKFEAACSRLGLPRNEGKRLAGAMAGSIQGGELRGEDGIFMLHPKKMQLDIGLCIHLLGYQKWDQKRTSGIIGRLIFAGAFRRPLLAGLAEVFHHFSKAGERTPSNQAYDEVLAMVGLLPFAFTNLRAEVNPVLHATDASPTGAGSCFAKQIKRPLGAPNVANTLCDLCGGEITELMATGQEVDCPKRCGEKFCSLPCYLEHRQRCSRKKLGVPTFCERWSGPNCPMTHAMLREGFDVLDPFDCLRGRHMDYFSEEGKQAWQDLSLQDPEYEHHAPDCKTMSRARGKPFVIGGKRYKGPPALRDERHVMGFSNLKGADAVKVRQGNKMGLASAKRCRELYDDGKYFSLEHPYRSFYWHMKPVIELAGLPHVRMAVFSNCCHGGRRRKWTAILTNNRHVYEALHCPDCPHGPGEDYSPYVVDGRVIFPTEEEAEYPEEMCSTYARAAARGFGLQAHVENVLQMDRVEQVMVELARYHRCQDDELRRKMAEEIVQIEEKCVPGQERQHLEYLLSRGHYRGTDIRLLVEHCGAKHMTPYPAGRWLWRELLSFKWKQEAHINVLEAQALFAHFRRVLRDPTLRSCRLLVVIDSQVLFYALGKGRSPSTQINRVLRRLMALMLACDALIYPLWTISAWNWADRPSRR